jgi:hypothetical protein
MSTELGNELRSLQVDVAAQLRRQAWIVAPTARHILQYLTLPAWAPVVAWDLYDVPSENGPGRLALVRSCWRQDLDMEKLHSPVERLKQPRPLVPTVEISELRPDQKALARLIAALAHIAIPPAPSSRWVTLDGIRFELAISTPNEHRLTWVGGLSEEAPELAAWLENVETLFAASWQNHMHQE